MIRVMEEGGCARNGINITSDWAGLCLKITYRLIVWVFWERSRAIAIHLFQNHSMYRPNDMDDPLLICQRCGVSSRRAPNRCWEWHWRTDR